MTFFIIFLVFIIGFYIYQYYFSEKAIMIRKMNQTKILKISDFKEGDLGSITGKVHPLEELIVAPFSKKQCVYFEITAEKEVSSGKSTKLELVYQKEFLSKFLLFDGNNYAYFDASDLKKHIVKDWELETNIWNHLTPEFEQFLEEKGIETRGFFGFEKNFKFKEGIIEGAELVTVYGKGLWKEASDLNLPTELGKILYFTNDLEENVMISDDIETTLYIPSVEKTEKQNLPIALKNILKSNKQKEKTKYDPKKIQSKYQK